MTPVMVSPQRIPRRSVSRLVLAAAAGVALACKLLSQVVNYSAFAGSSGTLLNRRHEGRQPQVYREAEYIKGQRMVPSWVKSKLYKDMNEMSDDELHNLVTISREYRFKHKMARFANRKPPRAALHEMRYKMAAAKSILALRASAEAKKAAEEAEPEEPELYIDFVRRTVDQKMARLTWAEKPGRKWWKSTPTPKYSWQGVRSRFTPYYNMPKFKLNGTAFWEEKTRANKKHYYPRNKKRAEMDTAPFRKATPNPSMVPPAKVM